MDDLISRQAAIDTVNNAFDRETLLTGFVRSIAVRAIRDMPSAQPEIIHCRDCKWHNGEINQCNAQICASMCSEDFCSRAEKIS
jgi:hypothetical protein